MEKTPAWTERVGGLKSGERTTHVDEQAAKRNGLQQLGPAANDEGTLHLEVAHGSREGRAQGLSGPDASAAVQQSPGWQVDALRWQFLLGRGLVCLFVSYDKRGSCKATSTF